MDDFDDVGTSIGTTLSDTFDSLLRSVTTALPGMLGVSAPPVRTYAGSQFSLLNPATWSPIHIALIGGAAYLLFFSGTRRRQ